MRRRKAWITILSLFLLSQYVVANRQNTQQTGSQKRKFTCSQSEAERNALLAEAEKGSYTARRLEFVGNENIRDPLLRRRILVNEGDLYTRKILEDSLTNLSKVRAIEKVSLENVVIELERPSKVVDTVICVTDKREKKKK